VTEIKKVVTYSPTPKGVRLLASVSKALEQIGDKRDESTIEGRVLLLMDKYGPEKQDPEYVMRFLALLVGGVKIEQTTNKHLALLTAKEARNENI
jgi:hypothetical protein